MRPIAQKDCQVACFTEKADRRLLMNNVASVKRGDECFQMRAALDEALPVSVVIPCFQCTSTIERAVKSVVEQVRPPAELILVDDCSGDGTLQLLYDISYRYGAWVKVFPSERNTGPSGARNQGWERASQPYIAFLDSDDTWNPNKLALQYDFMIANPDIALSGHQYMEQGESQYPASSAEKVVCTEIKSKALLLRNGIYTSTVMLARILPFRFRVTKRYAEDYDLWQRMAFSGYRLVRIESPLAYRYKSAYGEGGLGARLWAMEASELETFHDRRVEGHIGWIVWLLVSLFSLAKYGKRVVISVLMPARSRISRHDIAL